MSKSSANDPLFTVSLRYDISDHYLSVPAEGLGFLHPSGVRVAVGYSPDGKPALLTETDYDDAELLRLVQAFQPSAEPDEDDPRLTEEMSDVRQSHRGAANDVVGLLRWLLARPGGHRVVGRRGSARYRVRDEEEWRPLPMRRLAPLAGIRGRVSIDEEWRASIQAGVGSGLQEPLAHIILREAKDQIDPNPRSAVVLTMAALEAGLRQQLARFDNRRGGTARGVRNSKPWDGPANLMKGDVGDLLKRAHRLDVSRWVTLPMWTARRIEAGRLARNAVVHEGKPPPGRDDLLALARVVQDTLYLLDYQAGHEWALTYVGFHSGDAEQVFGTPEFIVEMAED